jgi:thiol-disulfide isomerase/thioredoxin
MKTKKSLLLQWLRITLLVAIVPVIYLGWDTIGAKFLTEAVHPPVTVNAIRLGTRAPDFSVPAARLAANKKFRFAELKGFPIVLHFWATWCGPCLQELPELLKLASELRPQGYSFVAVAIDRDWATLEEFFARNPQLRPIRDRMILVLDPDAEIATKYGSSRFPETFLINRDLVIDNKFVGAQPWSDPQMLPYLESLRGTTKQ